MENRNFEFFRSEPGISKGDWISEYEGLYGWKEFGDASLRIVSASPYAEENPHYLRFTSKENFAGFTNKAYDGITLQKDMTYNVSFYCRNVGKADNVRIYVKDLTGKEYGSVEIKLQKNTDEELKPWIKYNAVLKAKESIRHGIFTVEVSDPSVLEFDFFSMIPSDAVCGIFRKDLYDKLDAIHPGFIRFPGGCIIEGSTLLNRYDFKKTLRPLEKRTSNWSRWAVHHTWQPHKVEDGPEYYPYYNQTYGIGYYEFFLLCEKLNCKPLPVLNVGLACQFQSFETVDIESEEFKEYLQGAVDLIEFANGPVTSEWGKIRALLGHPEPFNLEMVGIGNEQWDTPNTRFFERYKMFESKIHSVYPNIKLIGSAGTSVTNEDYVKAWDFIRTNAKTNPSFAYAVDEHYYMPPEWFLSHPDFYDNYDRSVKVFAGEYAAHPGEGGTFNRPHMNTLEGAVSEAAFLTGVERNADVVVLASYAPLFARMGYSQWSPDMIWFDDEKSYGTPSYYVQKMYSNYTGDFTLDTKTEHKDFYSKGIFYNPTIDSKTGTVYLKIANTNDENIDLDLNSKYNFHFQKMIFIGGKEKTAFNSLDNMFNVKIEETEEKPFDGKFNLPKNSFSVIVLR
ncbi:MAG: carbohydrate binding domain-containing protein [Treponema sp.]|nr:carbohydrate binding domain-containing protein [Treponema sp.]